MSNVIKNTKIRINHAIEAFTIPFKDGAYTKNLTFAAVADMYNGLIALSDPMPVKITFNSPDKGDDTQYHIPKALFLDMVKIVKNLKPTWIHDQVVKCDAPEGTHGVDGGEPGVDKPCCGPLESCSSCPNDSDQEEVFTVLTTTPCGGFGPSGRQYKSENIRRVMADAIDDGLFIYTGFKSLCSLPDVMGKVVDFTVTPSNTILLDVIPFGPYADTLRILLRSNAAGSYAFKCIGFSIIHNNVTIVDDIVGVAFRDFMIAPEDDKFDPNVVTELMSANKDHRDKAAKMYGGPVQISNINHAGVFYTADARPVIESK